jgi:hypothetical protein
VTDPRDPVSIAQAVLVHMGGAEHDIHGETHALRLIEAFHRSRIGPLPAALPASPPPTKKQAKALRTAQRHLRRRNMLDREYERIMGPVTS